MSAEDCSAIGAITPESHTMPYDKDEPLDVDVLEFAPVYCPSCGGLAVKGRRPRCPKCRVAYISPAEYDEMKRKRSGI